MLSENLVALRSRHGYTQEKLAETVHVSRQAYANWEKGEAMPDVGKCKIIADFYNTTIDALVGDTIEFQGTKIPPAPRGKYMWPGIILDKECNISLPREACEIFDLKSGDEVVVLGSENEGIAIIKAEKLKKIMELQWNTVFGER